MSLFSAPAPADPGQRSRPAATNLIALCCVVALLYFGRAFLITLVVATVISFLLDPFVVFFMRFRLPRALASFLVCAIGLLVVYLLGLGAYSQLSGLAGDLPRYGQRLSVLIDNVSSQLEATENAIYDIVVPKRIREARTRVQIPAPEPKRSALRRRTPEPQAPPQPPPVQDVRIQQDQGLLKHVYNYLWSIYDAILMASFIPFLVYFMLSWREHVRRTFLQFFEGEKRLVAGKSWQGIADMARAYVVGNFLLAVVVSAISWILFAAVGLPYPLLLAPLSGFLSMIPYIGLPLSLIPPIAGGLMVWDRVAPFILICTVVAFLHLLALNLLYPKVVGARVHLNPLVVTVALMFWGSIWGAAGLVLAIPITAGIKAVCDNVEQLRPYGRFLGD